MVGDFERAAEQAPPKVEEVLFERERRRTPFTSFLAENLLESDPPNWGRVSGPLVRKEDVLLPPNYRWASAWCVDNGPDSGVDGWCHASNFSKSWSPSASMGAFVRQRRWIRKRELDGDALRQQRPVAVAPEMDISERAEVLSRRVSKFRKTAQGKPTAGSHRECEEIRRECAEVSNAVNDELKQAITSSRRTALKKILRDVATASSELAAATRSQLQNSVVHGESVQEGGAADGPGLHLMQEMRVQEADIFQQRDLLLEREDAMRSVERDVMDVMHVQRDLAVLVAEQDQYISSIENHMELVEAETRSAARQVGQAAKKQTSIRRPLSGAAIGGAVGAACGIVLGPPGVALGAAAGGGLGGLLGHKIGKAERRRIDREMPEAR